ncbi:MAG: NADH-quinone oxidoreductase subunit N [Thermodesulfobacteria bacterium]|nr:NADH-quinone oxidoreductase subunit N [Thermodesulfobacteriota bacterium]
MGISLNLNVIIPELLFLVIGCGIFLIDKFIRNKTYAFFIGLVTVAAALIFLFFSPFGVFTHAYHSDFYSVTLKILFLFGAILIFFISYNYLQSFPALNYGEYYALILFSLLGAFFMVSAMDLITIDLSMELMSFPLYFLIALNFADIRKSVEGAFKYFLLGSLGSVFFLIGIAFVYYLTHSVDLLVISKVFQKYGLSKLGILAFIFLLAGFSIKLAMVPFHMWSPDAYESAPLPVTTFIASLIKFVVMATLVKLIILGFNSGRVAIGELLIPIALLTILIGNVLAVKQDNIVRMLAYSSIAHAGYATLGLISANYTGYSFSLFYMFVYMLMAIGSFSLLIILAKGNRELLEIPNLAGLSKRSPFMAFMFVIFMFSLAGVPPTAGFMAKLYLFLALIKAKFILVAIFALLFSVIGAYPYLRVLKVIYMEKGEGKEFTPSYGATLLIPILVTSALILIIGIFPKPWTELFYKTVFFYITMLFYPH